MRYGLIALLMLTTLGCGKPGTKVTGPEGELNLLQGVWKPISAVAEGETVTDAAERFAGATVEFSGDRAVFKINGEVTELNRLVIDATVEPKAVDLAVIDEKGVVRQLIDATGKSHDCVTKGIYQIEGDRLKLCTPDGLGVPRPDQFDALPGSGLTVMTFQKVR